MRAHARPGTARRWILTLIVLGALAFLLSGPASTAVAEPQPSANASQAAAPAPPTDAPAPAPGGQANPANEPPADPESGVLGPFNVTDASGNSLTYYTITADSGAWNQWDRKLLIFMTNGTFAIVKLIIGFTCWLLNWGFSFAPASVLLAPAREVAAAFHLNAVERLHLEPLLLLLGGGWCGFMIIRGKASRGWSEMGITIVISAIAGTILLNPADRLMGDDGLLGTTRDTSMALASIISTNGASDNTDPKQAAKPLTDTLIDTYIVRPHQMLQFGTVLNDKADPECVTAYKEYFDYASGKKKIPADLLASGANTNVEAQFANWENVPEALMQAHHCKDLGKYNHNPSWDRLLGAVLLLLASLLVVVLVLLMVGVLLVSVVGLAFYAMAGNVVAVVAILPGGPRATLWRWVGGIAKIVMVIFAVVILIPLLATLLAAIMKSADGESLIMRFFLVDIITAGGLVYHRKLLTFGKRAGFRIARRMEMSRIGGSRGQGGYGGGEGYGGGYGGYGGAGRGWLGPGDPTSLSPVSASGMVHGVRAEIGRVVGPVTSTARTAGKVWTGDQAKGRRAVAGLGPDAGALKQKMYASRGGRVLWRTAKGGGLAGKVAWGSTVGLPVSAPRTARATSAATSRHYRAMKTRLSTARHAAGAATRDYLAEWGAGAAAAGRATGIPRAGRATARAAAETFGPDAERLRTASRDARIAWELRRAAARARHPAEPGPPRPATSATGSAPSGEAAARFRQRIEEARTRRPSDDGGRR